MHLEARDLQGFFEARDLEGFFEATQIVLELSY